MYIQAIINQQEFWKFDADKTFVIAGGLGGQGRSIAKWMVAKGARNLVLLSRSGLHSSRLLSFVEELRRGGATIYSPRCNIANAASVQEVVAYCEAHLPPIKGCIQAAMDIRVRLHGNSFLGG